MNYPRAFAKSSWQPFAPQSHLYWLMVHCDSTQEDLTTYPLAWFAASGYRYTEQEMGWKWNMVEVQKRKIQVQWDVQWMLFMLATWQQWEARK